MCTSCGCKTIAVIKQGALEPELRVTLLSGDDPIDLTTATSITCTLSRNGEVLGQLGMNADADQVTNIGQAYYAWYPDDTAQSGTLLAEIVVMWPSDRPQYFPDEGYFRIVVVPSLAPA
jgi:hypothetical protein